VGFFKIARNNPSMCSWVGTPKSVLGRESQHNLFAIDGYFATDGFFERPS